MSNFLTKNKLLVMLFAGLVSFTAMFCIITITARKAEAFNYTITLKSTTGCDFTNGKVIWTINWSGPPPPGTMQLLIEQKVTATGQDLGQIASFPISSANGSVNWEMPTNSGPYYFPIAINFFGQASNAITVAGQDEPCNVSTLNVHSSPINVNISGTYPGSTPYTSTGSTGTGLQGTLTAPNVAGYTFFFWSGCTSGSGASCVVSVNPGSTQTVTANYTVTSSGLGTPIPKPVSPPVCVASAPTYGPALNFSWSSVSGSTGYDLELSSSSKTDTVTGSFVNAGGGGFRVVKTVISNSTTGTGGWTSVGGAPEAVGGNLSLNPVTTYFWHVRATNSSQTSSWSLSSSFSTLACSNLPDLTVPSPRLNPAVPTVGDSVTFNDKVVNIGTGSSGTTFKARFCIDGTADSCYKTLVTRIGASDNTVEVLAPGALSLQVNSVVPWTATVGSHNVYFCADVVPVPPPGIVTESDDSSLSNCNGQTFTVTNPVSTASWVQTTKGDVGSMGSINFTSPNNTLYNADELVISKADINNTVSPFIHTAKSWLIKSYSGLILPSGAFNDPKTYQNFKDKFSGSADSANGGASNSIPGSNGVHILTTSNVSWDGTFSPTPNCAAGTKSGAIIFVDSGLTITGNTTVTSCPVVIFVSGQVTINANVTKVNAMIISDHFFTDSASSPPSPTNQLTINGGVIAGLNPIASDKINLLRDLGPLSNATTPAEMFNYDPKYLWYLTDLLGITKDHFSEVNP